MYLLPSTVIMNPLPGQYGEYSLAPGYVNVHSIIPGRYVGQHIERMAQDLSVRFTESYRPYGELTGIHGSLWREPMILTFTKESYLSMENLTNVHNIYVFKRLDD